MTTVASLDAAGRRRSAATFPEHSRRNSLPNPAFSGYAAVLLERCSNPDVQAAVRKLAAWSECPRPGILRAKSTEVAD
jgi:hypothetical protein